MNRLGLTLVLCSLPALADLTMVQEVVASGKKRVVTLSVKGSRAFFELQEGDAVGRTMLRDADEKKLYLVDHAKKLAVVVTEEDSKALELRQNALRAQMQAQLEKMSPEQRKRIEATMLGPVPGADAKQPVFVYEKKKSPPRKVNGFSCQDYVIKRDGAANGEGCFMSWKDAGLSAESFKGVMTRAMPTNSAVGAMGNAFDAHGTAPGFPVVRTSVDSAGQPASEMTLKSLSKSALSAEHFEVPKDYEQRAMGEAVRGPTPTK